MPRASLGNNVRLTGSSALYPGAKTDVGTTAAAIGSSQACNEILVQADPDNVVNVLVGSSVNQYIKLQPGDSINIQCSNVNLVYVKTVSGTATVNYLARS